MIIVEPCSGAAAVTLRLLGQKPITPYLGGKAQYADAIISALGIEGEPIEGMVLGDAGPWGTVWETLGRFKEWQEVADKVERLGRLASGKALFDMVAAAVPPAVSLQRWPHLGSDAACGFTAAFLLLQSASARGKPVYPGLTSWSTPGYAHLSNSARGKGFSERLRPDLLAKRIMELGAAVGRHGHRFFWGGCGPMEECGDHIRNSPASRVVVYIDPPYQETTGYQHSVTPEMLRTVAERWRSDGALVAVSEGAPLPWEGWHHVRLARRGGGARLGRVSEWLTMSRPPVGQLPLSVEASTRSGGRND